MTAIKVSKDGRCTLAHPLAEPGPTPSGGSVWLVADVPPGVKPAAVLDRFARTVIWSPTSYVVPHAALGAGRLYLAYRR